MSPASGANAIAIHTGKNTIVYNGISQVSGHARHAIWLPKGIKYDDLVSSEDMINYALQNCIESPNLISDNSLDQYQNALNLALSRLHSKRIISQQNIETRPDIRYLNETHHLLYPNSDYSKIMSPVINSSSQVERDGKIVTF